MTDIFPLRRHRLPKLGCPNICLNCQTFARHSSVIYCFHTQLDEQPRINLKHPIVCGKSRHASHEATACMKWWAPRMQKIERLAQFINWYVPTCKHDVFFRAIRSMSRRPSTIELSGQSSQFGNTDKRTMHRRGYRRPLLVGPKISAIKLIHHKTTAAETARKGKHPNMTYSTFIRQHTKKPQEQTNPPPWIRPFKTAIAYNGTDGRP